MNFVHFKKRESSTATIETYIRDVRGFAAFVDDAEIDKRKALRYVKEQGVHAEAIFVTRCGIPIRRNLSMDFKKSSFWKNIICPLSSTQKCGGGMIFTQNIVDTGILPVGLDILR